MPQSLRLTVNGDSTSIEAGATVADLVRQQLGIPAGEPVRAAVATEVNGDLVTRADWGKRPLGDGDVVEIITAQGGG